MPKISIIILVYNSFGFIRPCLDSVFSQDYRDVETIVIDNGSKDGTVDFIKENYPRVRLIENKENLGACKARNQGIEIAQGSWILTLDCDIILEKDFLKKIMGFGEEVKEDIGMLQPKILNINKKTIYSCGIYLSSLRRFHDIGRSKLDKGQFDNSKYIFGACSAAAFYKRQMLQDLKEKTGYFDERFFFLVEDVDLAWRAQRKSWKALFYPEAICYHAGNSSNANPKLKQYLCFRNRYYLIIKNENFKNLLKIFFTIFIYDLPRLFFLIFTNPHSLKILLGRPRILPINKY